MVFYEIDLDKHLLRKCTHEMQDLLKEWDKLQHAQRMKSVLCVIRDFELLEEALEEQGQSESRHLRIFTGGILATLAVHVLFKFIAACPD